MSLYYVGRFFYDGKYPHIFRPLTITRDSLTRTGRDTNCGGIDMENNVNAMDKPLKWTNPKYPSEPFIPKYRFDCVSLCLKETKQKLAKLSAELGTAKKRAAELETALLNTAVEKALAIHRAKCIPAAKALIDLSKLKPENGVVPGLEEEILRIKESRGYLFEGESEAYILLPARLYGMDGGFLDL